jgi:hypothetical protein
MSGSHSDDSNDNGDGSDSDSEEGDLKLEHFKNFKQGTAVFYPGSPHDEYPSVGGTDATIYVGRVVGVYVKGGKKHTRGLETVFMEPVVQGEWGGAWVDSVDVKSKFLFPPVTVQPEQMLGLVNWETRPVKAGGTCKKTFFYKGVLGERNWRVMCDMLIENQHA